MDDNLYAFVMRGELTKSALEKTPILSRHASSDMLAQEYIDCLSLDLLDDENGEIEIAATLENVADENAVCVAARKDYTERHKNAFYFFLEELEGSLEKAGDGTNDSAENAKKFGIENGEVRVYDFKRINGENEKISDMLSVDKGFYYVNPF